LLQKGGGVVQLFVPATPPLWRGELREPSKLGRALVFIRGAPKSSKSANSPIYNRCDHAVPSTYAKSKSAYADFCAIDFRKKTGIFGIRNLVSHC
jgi:hypothetical protein